jgi:predicted CXXCH cytochrome family protein
MCHEKDLAAEEWTTTMTGFRNGEQNLHYVHVHKAVKGRTCRACHDAHATNNPRHIRDSVPFGNWSLPVGYTKTETGGQCLPGCHQMFRYDRKNPVDNRK